jgi:polysaccharide biosynthesis protein PslH
MRPRMGFVSTMFLQPEDTGARIRTCNVLRGLKGGRFDITLLGPGAEDQKRRYAQELQALCDRFISWAPPPEKPRWMRAADVFGRWPVNVLSSVAGDAMPTVSRVLNEQQFDLVVFDFLHASPLFPAGLAAPTVCFTHNVETEIFERHAQQASSRAMRLLWAQQARKMRRFERDSLHRYDKVIAVSERDASIFEREFGCERVSPIPTGVDLDYFSFSDTSPIDDEQGGKVVFTGSMDWDANINGVQFFLREVWPLILKQRPRARFEVIGRNPAASLLKLAKETTGVHFTGRVDDVRPHVRSGQVFVIPLRVGGGTRIKTFEAMAMGCPVVSTTLGVEGLDVLDEEHLLIRDDPAKFALAVLTLLDQPERSQAMAAAARDLVQTQFGHRAVAAVFEEICLSTLRT